MSPGTSASRAAALAILALLLGLFYAGPVASYAGFLRGANQRVVAAKATLAGDRRLIAEGTPPQPAQNLLFPTMSDAEAAALLQEALKQAAAKAQIEVGGLQVLPVQAVAGARRVGVRVRAKGDMAGIARLLYAIEAARPVLYPDNLQIESRTAAALDFQIEVSGFTAGAS